MRDTATRVGASLRELTARHGRTGVVTDIVLRPQRGEPAVRVDEALAVAGRGLEGDRRAVQAALRAPASATRELTLFQAEHVPLVAHWVGRDAIDVRLLRRNLVVAGINLLAMRSPFADQPLHWRIGETAVIRITGPCDPCSRMEAALGIGGYNALRGHGGVTACLIEGGRIRVGDTVRLEPPA